MRAILKALLSMLLSIIIDSVFFTVDFFGGSPDRQKVPMEILGSLMIYPGSCQMLTNSSLNIWNPGS
jgi:hypothetical protein